MEIFGFPVADLGAGVIVTGFVILVATGKLVPKARADRELDFRDEMVKLARAESDTWKSVALESGKVNSVLRQENVEQREQISKLVDTGEEHVRLIAAMRDFLSTAPDSVMGGEK